MRQPQHDSGLQCDDAGPVHAVNRPQTLRERATCPGPHVSLHGASQVEPAYIHNLHQQIHFLELEVKCLRTSNPAPAEDTNAAPPPPAAEDAAAAEAARSALIELHTAERTKAMEQIARVRDQFALQRKARRRP